ncbi:uncharacterized protein F4812DRAFT_464055 [Daldinia caldariorum]|uniref:uncharacterized protein n=1 Tax=Daldinia caldariorum TaxID=326644 RepID=UPI002007CD4E|nr:uncharacterized protein F4812DRAFT_464055 [Daldinia caldariorum]KAI1463056.1 hypothetical protein F4812DRAFT_464055 [Daldinia caldariorum]
MASTSSSISVSTLPSSMTSDTDNLPTIQFTNIEALAKAVYQIRGGFDCAVIEGVSPTDMENLVLRETNPFRIRQYYSDRAILIISIPTHLHEALHLGLYKAFIKQLFLTRQDESWAEIGSATFEGHPGGNNKEGDSSGGPTPVRYFKGAWPTLVIEAGLSQTLPQLQLGMRWWFSTSDHQVKIVLLVKFDYTNQSILIERWEEEAINPQSRPGATTTGQVTRSNALQPLLRQRITITRDATTDSYHVTSGALELSFRLLFLRDPGPQEGDFLISVEQLENYARNVWRVV